MFTLARWILGIFMWLAQFLPGNLLRKWLLTPRGYAYILPATLLVVPYAAFGYWLYLQIQAGAAHPALLLVVMGCVFGIYHQLVLTVEVLKARAVERIAAAFPRRRAGAHTDTSS